MKPFRFRFPKNVRVLEPVNISIKKNDSYFWLTGPGERAIKSMQFLRDPRFIKGPAREKKQTEKKVIRFLFWLFKRVFDSNRVPEC